MSRNDRQARIRELEEEIRARGAAYHVDEDFDEEMREAFLEHVLAFEDAPETTLRERLSEAGHREPGDLRTLIAQLASINVFIESTNHLSDAELYEWLTRHLDQPSSVPDIPDLMTHIDVIGGCSEEDLDLYLRYYSSEEDREEWKRQFPDEEIPPKEVPPYDRDRFLPSPYGEEVS